jgi:hypothetical protein
MIEITRRLPIPIAHTLPVFATEAFLAARSSNYGWFATEDFALPFIIDSRLGLKRLVFTTETIPLRGHVQTELELTFLNQVITMCSRSTGIRVDFIATPQKNAVFRTVPCGTECIDWGSYIVDLTKPEPDIFAAFHSKHRNVIRKAETEGVVISTTNDIATVQRCLKDTMSRQHLLFFPSLSYLLELKRHLGERITFYTATRESTLQGVAVVVHNHVGAFYYYGGSVEHPFTGSLNFMQYEIIKDLKYKGIPVYDLMGARLDTGGDPKVEGIQRFKSRFASGMRTGYSFRQIIHPIRYRLFVSAVKAYFVLRGSRYNGDVIDQARQKEPTAMPQPVETAKPI